MGIDLKDELRGDSKLTKHKRYTSMEVKTTKKTNVR